MLRADACATLCLFDLLPKRDASRRGRVPILMYHSVSESAPTPSHPYYETLTTPSVFERQMQFLKTNGYKVTGIAQAIDYLHARNGAPERPVVITFDDGLRDFRTNALPILSRYGFVATVFVATGLIGTSPAQFRGGECMRWSEIQELRAGGVQFGSHTVTHPQLRSAPIPKLRFEIEASKEQLEQQIGERVESFSYPYAFPETDRPFKNTLRTLLTDAGYVNGVTTIIGTAKRTDDRLFLKRLPVNRYDDDRLLRAKLQGSYDWLHAAQFVSKMVSARHGGRPQAI